MKDAQVQWCLILLNDGTYKIAPKGKENYCITIDGNELSNGTNVIVSEFKGLDNQKWVLSEISDNTYILKSKADLNYCIDESQLTLVDNSNVQIWKYEANNRQQWILHCVKEDE